MNEIKIGSKVIGYGHPTYIIGEIGINHNGDINVAKQMIKMATDLGVDAVKFQKRTPDICVPENQKNIMRDTPWGYITYLDYKKRIEFEHEEYIEISKYCKLLGVDWFASPWDTQAVEFLDNFNPVCYKIASATLTDFNVLDEIKKRGKPIILSTGMSTMEEIKSAVKFLKGADLLISHSTSSYPCAHEELNLKMIQTLKNEFPFAQIGYSGHEKGVTTSVAAVVLGATHVERHITLDRTMWGTDQSASLGPKGLAQLVRDIRIIEQAMGDGFKRVYDSEVPIRKKLRGE